MGAFNEFVIEGVLFLLVFRAFCPRGEALAVVALWRDHDSQQRRRRMTYESGEVDPALLKRQSRRPKRETAWAMAPLTSASRLTSACT